MTIRKLIPVAALLVSASSFAGGPPAVNNDHGIGWTRGAVFGVTMSTDFAWSGSFTALERPSNGAEVSIDLARLIVFGADSDRYAYWLATNTSFGDLVAAWKLIYSSGQAEKPTDGPLHINVPPRYSAYGGAAIDPQQVLTSMAAQDCSAEMHARKEKDQQVLYKSYACEQHELRVRQLLTGENPARALVLMGDVLSNLASSAQNGNDSNFSLPGHQSFSRGKRRIAVAYRVIAQAGYVAATGKTNELADNQLMYEAARLRSRLAQEAKASEGGGFDKAILQLRKFNRIGNSNEALSYAEMAAIYTQAITGGKQKLASEVRQAIPEM